MTKKDLKARILKEARKTAERPTRLLRVTDRDSRELMIRAFRRDAGRTVGKWESNDGWGHRTYASYDQYVAHQASKIKLLDLNAYQQQFESELADRLTALDIELAGRPVLCLAARLGAEVKAFKRVGAFAVGIDLNPGEDNHHVVVGDFHHLDFADNSVGIVYTNSLDHSLDLHKIVTEVRRVLMPDGIFIVEAVAGSDEMDPNAPDSFSDWEATSWPTLAALIARISEDGFTLRGRSTFEFPWSGETLRFALDHS